MRRWLIYILVTLGMAAPVFAVAEASVDAFADERAAVAEKMEADPHHLVLAVNGLCCRNCAIGIGKMVYNLDFIDTEKLPKGVKIHRKDGLLTVAVKKDEKMDMDVLVKAIRKAGYDPVRLYRRKPDGSLGMTTLPGADVK